MRVLFLFVKQKTTYDLRISDWSSDVCSSDLSEKSEKPKKHSTAVRDQTAGRGLYRSQGETARRGAPLIDVQRADGLFGGDAADRFGEQAGDRQGSDLRAGLGGG